MAPGVRTFAGTQIGIESTKGTPVAATRIYRGPVAFPVFDMPLVYTPEDVGISGGTDRSHRPSKKAMITFPKAVPTFEDEPYFAACGIKDLVTGVADGVGSGKIYTYPLPTTAAYDIKTLTVEAFDDYQEYESEDVFFTEYNLSGKIDEAWQREAKSVGRQVSKSTKTGALTLPTVNDMLFQNTKLFIDAIGGTIGTTQVTNSFLAAEAKLVTGWKPQPTGDGNLYWSFPKYVGYKLTGKLRLEHDAFGVAQYDTFAADPTLAKLMQIKVLGPALTTPGTAYSYRTAILNAPIKYTKASEIKDEGGNDVIELEWESKYNATALIAASYIFVNEVTAL